MPPRVRGWHLQMRAPSVRAGRTAAHGSCWSVTAAPTSAPQHMWTTFAKHKLLAHCRRHGIAHTAIGGFSDALALLPSLHDGSLFPPASIPVEAAISPA
jgi:hypothetical protein